jgi:hypothetical protein
MMAAGLEWEKPLPGLRRLMGWYGQTDMVFDLDINDREFLEGLGIVDKGSVIFTPD